VPPPTIILLNGTSSSGKSSLLRELQRLLPEPYLDAGIDKFIWMLPGRYLNMPLWSEVFSYHYPNPADLETFTIQVGPLGQQLTSGMHHAIAALAAAGNHVIADHVLLDPVWLRECVSLWQSFRVYFFGVRCPLEVVEQRERNRQDRTLGQARAQFDVVHAHACYDGEVDTSLEDVQTCARRILDGMANQPVPQAFMRLHARYQELPR